MVRKCLEKNYSDHNGLVAKICTRLTKNLKVPYGKTKKKFEEAVGKRTQSANYSRRQT
jgi:hypothetical protein